MNKETPFPYVIWAVTDLLTPAYIVGIQRRCISMVAQLIWIAAVYGVAVILIHVLHNRKQTRQTSASGKRLHYILITRNHEAVVEWYIRIMGLHALWTGKPSLVTVMDDGSSDGTMAVASRLLLGGSPVDFAPAAHIHTLPDGGQSPKDLVIDLRLPGKAAPLPFMRLPGSGGYGSKHGD